MSNNYWIDRFTAEENRINELSKEQVKEAKKQYDIALKNVNQKIYEFYAKYAKDNNISMYEAKQRFNKKELKEFKMSLSEYVRKGQSLNISPNDNIVKELKNASSRVHIERLEALKIEIKAEIDLLSKTMENNLGKHLREVYRDTYYRSAYNIQKGLDKFSNIEKLNPELIESLVYKPWTKDNTNWSKRIWGNDSKLVNTLHTNLTQNIITGKPLKEVIDTIAERFNVEKNIASRLIMTESAAYHSKAKEKCMKDLGCEKYEVIATLDDRTSAICRSMDSKIFDMKDYQVGVTAPPFHSNCYDKETEVYTNSGWKLFKDLNENELVFTINPDNLESEWQKPINYISYKYHGNMISFKNSRFDLLVTPNHNILVQNSDYSVKDKTWKLIEASKVGRKSKHRMFAGLNWTGANKEYEILAKEKVDIETYLKFMAYWLSDGSCTLDKNSYTIKIAQCNNDWMYEDLKKFPFKIYKCKESLIVHNKELGKELSKFGKCTTKFIPDNIKELSPELIRIFLLAYSKADGSVRKGKVWKGYKFNDSIQFFTSSDKLASDLGELILKVGGRPSYYLNKCAGKEVKFRNGVYTINKDVWIINWNTQLHNYLYNMEIKDIEYNDYVYCLEVPKYNTLLVRRNGKICWSGNCRTVTAPYYDKIEGDANLRASRTEDNDYELVDVKDYQDWYDRYVEKNNKSSIIKENIPLTLEKFNKYSKNWKNEVIDKILTEEEQNLIRKKMKNVEENSAFLMRIPSTSIDNLVQKNKFMNLFESGNSGGVPNIEARMKVSKNLFGHNLDKESFVSSEKYGYLSSKDFLRDIEFFSKRHGTSQYGGIIIKFNKEKIKERATYTLDDSLLAGAIKAVVAGDFNTNLSLGIDKYNLKKYYGVLKNLSESDDAISLTKEIKKENGFFRYIELQYHGDITLDEVNEICFTKDLPEEDIIKILKDKNIKLFRLEGGKIVKVF